MQTNSGPPWISMTGFFTSSPSSPPEILGITQSNRPRRDVWISWTVPSDGLGIKERSGGWVRSFRYSEPPCLALCEETPKWGGDIFLQLLLYAGTNIKSSRTRENLPFQKGLVDHQLCGISQLRSDCQIRPFAFLSDANRQTSNLPHLLHLLKPASPRVQRAQSQKEYNIMNPLHVRLWHSGAITLSTWVQSRIHRTYLNMGGVEKFPRPGG